MKRGYSCLLFAFFVILSSNLLMGCAKSVLDPGWLKDLRQAHKEILAGNDAEADRLIQSSIEQAGKQGGCPQPVKRHMYSHTFAEDLQLVARAYRAQGKPEKAEKLLRIALEMGEKCNLPASQVDSCLYDLAEVCQSMGHAAQARDFYDRVLKGAGKRNPELAANILLMRASDLVKQKDLKGAEALYLEACGYEKMGTTIGAQMQLAQFYKDQGRYAEAEGIYRKLLGERNKDTDWPITYIHYEMGELYRAQKKFAEAERFYQEILSSSENWDLYRALALSGLAELEDQQGHYDKACSYYEQAKSTETKNNTEFLERYASFLRRHNKADDAVKTESDLQSAVEAKEHGKRFSGVYFNP